MANHDYLVVVAMPEGGVPVGGVGTETGLGEGGVGPPFVHHFPPHAKH